MSKRAPVLDLRGFEAGYVAGVNCSLQMMIPPRQLIALGVAAGLAIKNPKVDHDLKGHLMAFLLWCKEHAVQEHGARTLMGLNAKWLTDD